MRVFLRACGGFAIVLVVFFLTVRTWDYFALRCPSGEALELKAPFERIGTGFAYAAAAPSLASVSDTNTAPSQSKYLLCENNTLLGPPHTLHLEIIAYGEGRFSHYASNFIFSTSDNSDPNTNGRRYSAVRTAE